MNEQFDIDLKNHVSKVFENYEDLSADAGWELLRERFPERKKDRGVIWWWYSIAAGLLLFAGLLFMPNKKTTTVARHQVGKNKYEVIVKTSPLQVSKRNHVTKDSGMPINSNKTLSARLFDEPSINHHKFSRSTSGKTNNGYEINNPPLVIAEKNIVKSATSIAESLQTSIAIADSGNKRVLAKTTEAVAANATLIPSDANTITDPVLKMMANDKARQAKTNIAKEARKTESMVAISPFAATYFNYAKGSSNDVNVGAGVTTDFKVNSKLKFSTGIAIAQNTLNFGNNSIPQKVATAAFANIIVSSPASSAPNGSINSQGDAASYGFYLNNYKANLIGLDIPINLKYQVNSRISVSAGISSGTFINETYTTLISNVVANANSTFTSNQHFGTFDFAKTVNFSFGLGYPIGGNHIIVEPFLKYPIGGLGSQNLKFGASGLNLKFNFSTIKK